MTFSTSKSTSIGAGGDFLSCKFKNGTEILFFPTEWDSSLLLAVVVDCYLN